ncbi:MAG: class I SAM-dependent methyltransferase [Pyrinomonadaceae bacterium]
MQIMQPQVHPLIKRLRSLLWRTRVYGKLRMFPSQVRSRRFDARHGVRTAGCVDLRELGVEGQSVAHANDYEPINTKLFGKILRTLPIKHEDFVFIDFGSGMGRALLLAAEFPFRQIIGIEFSSRLHGIAEDNIRRYENPARRCADVESVCTDAVAYAIPPAQTVFFLYNPFKETVMTNVLVNIRQSLKQHPREVWIIYVNPRLDRLLDGDDMFTKIASGKGYTIRYTIYRNTAEKKSG